MADSNPAPAVAVEDTPVDNVVATTEEHVHGPDCSHDHTHDQEHSQQAAQRNDFDLLELNGTKDKTTDPLVKVRDRKPSRISTVLKMGAESSGSMPFIA